MTITFHAWVILPAALIIAGLVAATRTEPSPGWWGYDFVHPMIAAGCWIAALAAILGHYL
jgi:hypothetical protein